MPRRRSLKVILLAALALFLGCDVAGTVIDLSNVETQVTGMHIDGPGTMKIFCGAGVKNVPLEAFESITLFHDETRTIDGEFCFAADILMRDGTRLAGRDKTRDGKPRTYVPVNQTLIGASHRGEFRIELSGVSKINFQ